MTDQAVLRELLPKSSAVSRDAQAQSAVKRMDISHARDRRETAMAMRSGTTSADGSRPGSPKGPTLPFALNLSAVKEAKDFNAAAAARERARPETRRPRLRRDFPVSRLVHICATVDSAGAGAKTARTAIEDDRRGLKGSRMRRWFLRRDSRRLAPHRCGTRLRIVNGGGLDLGPNWPHLRQDV